MAIFTYHVRIRDGSGSTDDLSKQQSDSICWSALLFIHRSVRFNNDTLVFIFRGRVDHRNSNRNDRRKCLQRSSALVKGVTLCHKGHLMESIEA